MADAKVESKTDVKTAPADSKAPAASTCLECSKPSTLQCPTCKELKLSPAHFCSQECFKKAWANHNQSHKEARERLAYKPPQFPYTGPLRPHWRAPMRSVPPHIQKPDYYLSGESMLEQKDKATARIPIYTPEEIQGVREACRIGREVLDIAGKMVAVGVTTDEIDRVVHEETIKRNAYPSPLNYYHFPKSCCTSINEVICHGIPDSRPLENGDIINIDISVYYKGFHADLNETYCVGNVDAESKRLIRVTYEALEAAIALVRPNTMVRDFGEAISKVVHRAGFSVVRSYCGHGIGRLFHCAPSIPHYAKNKGVGVLKPGMIFTIEPMINAGVWKDKLWPDDWTSATEDGKRSAQFEHTLLVTETGCEILTARTPTSPKLWWELEPIPAAPKPASAADAKAKPAADSTEAKAAGADDQKDKKKKKKKNNKKKAEGAAPAADASKADPAPAGDAKNESSGSKEAKK